MYIYIHSVLSSAAVLEVYLAVELPKHSDPGLVELIVSRQRLSLTVERIHLSWRQTQLLHTWR